MSEINNESCYTLPIDLQSEFIQVDDVIKCIACSCEVRAKKRSQLTQHLLTVKHQKAKAINAGSSVDQSSSEQFKFDLLKTLVATNIPYFKVNNRALKAFLMKYTGMEIPNESTLRRHISTLFQSTIQKIRDSISDSAIWISIDETTDTLGRCVIIVVIGPLDLNKIGESYCLNLKFTEHYNNVIISQTIIDSLQILWPDGIHYDKVHLILTDGASYMALAASNLKMCFTKMIHITCLAHGLNRVCEFIRSRYELVDKLISKGKKVFLKAPHRRTLFRQIAPRLSLPPEPCITRWGTWLSASIYYKNNLEIFHSVVAQLDSDEAQSIVDLKSVLSDPLLSIQLNELTENFTFLVDFMKNLQASDLKLATSIQFYRDIDSILVRSNCSNSFSVYEKFKRVINRNTDFSKIIQISDAYDKAVQDLPYSDQEIKMFQSAPVTTCEVERKFSQYKLILSDRRTRFTEENLKMYFVVQTNSDFSD